MAAGAGLGVDLAREEGGSVSRDVPAVLQEESLQVVHLFTQPLAGAQGLSAGGRRDRQSEYWQRISSIARQTHTLYSWRILLVQWYALFFTLEIGTIDFRFSSLLEINEKNSCFIHHESTAVNSALRKCGAEREQRTNVLLEEALLMLLALVVAVDDLQEEAG